ncbi:hypothetical protein [Asticcacaulis endophyticus]|uniref:Uncharacterized protein n=1 Tax=Asticcacaulis endophyticus TaxID=1395890 RepID=A0A918PTR1_9CAUL|nr:hypothetical protein [Asticcacaulis endophyticus]GGZ21689.1 hypothetical protein GCM10011273_03080 [Asticcacaulis endophyticus]
MVTVSGGQGANGVTRRGRTDGGGLWRCEMTVPLLNVPSIKVARAFLEDMDGGAAQILVPFYPEAEAPYPLGVPGALVTHSDGSTFSDDTMYQSDAIEVELAQSVALRATTVFPTLTAIADLDGGEMFSAVHDTYGEHIYVVTRILDDGSWRIRPPWREASNAETPLNFDNPKCVMHLINADEAMEDIRPPYLSSMTLVFEESLDPVPVN